ncbi:MAG TPA: hypothetical protein VLX09_07660 [Stellaceae bacterium]|nr:hypothetical protein [Stellaceae bacterium]
MTGRTDVLIDDRGSVWPDDSPSLLDRLGCRASDFDVAGYAVRNLGFIHVRAHGAGVRVALRRKMFSYETLIAALYEIVDWAPRRILLAVLSDGAWSLQMCATLGMFTARAEALAAGEPLTTKRWFAIEHDPKILYSRDYSVIWPMLACWRASRGKMGDAFFQIFRGKFYQQRATLVRRASNSSPWIFEHFGTGIKTVRPCEALALVGSEMTQTPDPEYGSWVAESFAEAGAGRRPRVESVRAKIRTWDDATIDASYSRVLLPWRRGADDLVLGMSILRDRSLVP